MPAKADRNILSREPINLPVAIPANPPNSPPAMNSPTSGQSTKPDNGVIRRRRHAEGGDRDQRRPDRVEQAAWRWQA